MESNERHSQMSVKKINNHFVTLFFKVGLSSLKDTYIPLIYKIATLKNTQHYHFKLCKCYMFSLDSIIE